jgi:hypothetical protein
MTDNNCNGTDPDAEHWQAIWEAMDYAPTADDLVRAEAANDQIEAALREAERYDCRRTEEHTALTWAPDVREKLRQIMTAHHVRIPDADYGNLQTFVEIPSGYGTPLLFDKNDSRQWSGGLFGLVAGNEREVHVLRGDYSVSRWLEDEKRRRRDCQWRGPRCTERGNCLLTFSAGAWVVGVPSCFACEAWLLAGGSRNAPLTHLGL